MLAAIPPRAGVRRVAAHGAGGQRRRGGRDPAAAGRGGVAAHGAIGQCAGIAKDAASKPAGIVAAHGAIGQRRCVSAWIPPPSPVAVLPLTVLFVIVRVSRRMPPPFQRRSCR